MAEIQYIPDENPSGELNPSPTPYSKMRFKIEAEADIVTNSSRVVIKLQAATEDRAGSVSPKGKITINGTEYIDDDLPSASVGYSGWYDIWTRETIVQHNDEGTGVLILKTEPTGWRDYYSLLLGSSTAYSTPNKEYSVSMPKINTGLVHIDNGQSFERYMIYVDNGTSWDKSVAYVDNGSEWIRCV